MHEGSRCRCKWSGRAGGGSGEEALLCVLVGVPRHSVSQALGKGELELAGGCWSEM